MSLRNSKSRFDSSRGHKIIMERFPHQESYFDSLMSKRAEEGWGYAGQEQLTKIRFSHDARFLPVTTQSEESIREKYIRAAQEFEPDGKFEVDLVLDENTERLLSLKKILTPEEYQDALTRLHDEDKNYFVFVRKIK